MTKKQIFKKAAQKIADGEERFSCNAVCSAAAFEEFSHALEREYVEFISPRDGSKNDLLLVSDFEGSLGVNGQRRCLEGATPKTQLHRSLALLFAGEVLK